MKLFDVTDRYCKESDWKTLGLLKTCLFAMGIMVGMQIPKRHRNVVLGISCTAFVLTYIPLMVKFFKIWENK